MEMDRRAQRVNGEWRSVLEAEKETKGEGTGRREENQRT